jgi:hypothetical protein
MQKELMSMLIGKVLWVLAAIFLLIVTLYFYIPTERQDADILLVYGMLILAFPSGFLVAGLFSFLNYTFFYWFGTSLFFEQYSRASIVSTWGAFFVCGYIQWFVLFPNLFRTFRRRLSG